MWWVIILFFIASSIFMGYLGWHLYQLLPQKIRYKKVITILAVILIIVLSIYKMLLFGFVVNICLFFVLFDLVHIIVYKSNKLHSYWQKIYVKGIGPIGLSLLLSFYGMYNAHKIVITNYTVEFQKEMNDKTILVVADMHLSTAVSTKELDFFLETVKKIQPEAVFLVGDIYDESTTNEDASYSFEVFEEVTKYYPVFYVEGNHELGYGNTHPIEKFDVVNNLEKIGVEIVFDEVVEWEDIYIIGRLDYSDGNRMIMEDLMVEVDVTKPIIVLDHQPKELKRNSQRGVDLEISGHTHAGQMFPIGQLDTLFSVNEMNYGYRKIDNFHAIVTSGMGMWGYPMRTSKHSEIVIIDIIGK